MMKYTLLVFLAGGILITSCGEDDDPGIGTNPDMMQEDPCDGVTATFSDDVLPILNAACALSGCHVTGGQGSGNFESYAGVKAKADNGSLLNRAVIQGNMPPSNSSGPQSLTDDQKLAIQCWIDAGAMNN